MKITDELLYLNVSSARDEWFSLSMKDNLKYEHDFSYRFKRKIRKLIRQNKDKVNYKSFRPAIVWSLVAFILLSGTISTYAYKEALLNVFKKIHKDITEYYISSEVDKAEIKGISIEYIPEGYTLQKANENDVFFLYNYVNENDSEKDISITVNIYSKQSVGTIGIDTEDAYVKQIMIGAHEAEYVEKGLIKHIIFTDENAVITVFAREMDEDEIIKIAENIKIMR